eukprot:scaffold28828_cov62-Attheya_sp.AAC.3
MLKAANRDAILSLSSQEADTDSPCVPSAAALMCATTSSNCLLADGEDSGSSRLSFHRTAVASRLRTIMTSLPRLKRSFTTLYTPYERSLLLPSLQ